MHPLARPGNKSGALGVKSGDRVRHVKHGGEGVADEFLSDGDVFVTWDTGHHDTVKWDAIAPVY